MATIICMDGLGGLPSRTFGNLKSYLERGNHRVVYAPINGIRTHEDRISKVLETYKGYNRDFPNEDIFLLGQSAGGGAVRVAAARLADWDRKVTGVILLSQSMPRFVSYLTRPLFKCMLRRTPELVLGKAIETQSWEYRQIVDPLPENFDPQIIEDRQIFPGLETRELAFNPPKFVGYSYPTLVMYGERDRWISPHGHRKVCEMLKNKVSFLDAHEVRGSGHLTLASDRQNEVMGMIKKWIERF